MTTTNSAASDIAASGGSDEACGRHRACGPHRQDTRRDQDDAAVRFTARMYVEHYAEQRGITVDEIGVAPTVVLSWAPGVVHRLAVAVGWDPDTSLQRNWMWVKRSPMYTGTVGARRVTIAHVGVGAPKTVAMMEEMIACGARTLLALGWAGSLQPLLGIGALLVPTSCLAEDGTSPHYTTSSAVLGPAPTLVVALEAAASENTAGNPAVNAETERQHSDAGTTKLHLGPLWTTDAPYRERIDTIAAYRSRGVLGVDMETSAMYALGQFRGVRVCNLLVISDEVWRPWHSAAYTAELRSATDRAAALVLRALALV